MFGGVVEEEKERRLFAHELFVVAAKYEVEDVVEFCAGVLALRLDLKTAISAWKLNVQSLKVVSPQAVLY